MAPLALAAVLPQVHVILRVAVRARGIELHLVRGLLVTVSTDELGVCAGEREMCLLAVVELPDAPAIGGVAAGAVAAQATFVKIIWPMAVDATGAGILVRARDVTLLARHRHVQADEREAGQVVIEVRAGTPALRRVTLSAVDSEFSGVDVAGAVTAEAIRRELLARDIGRMASMAGHFLVQSLERPPSIARVIERCRQPFLVAVAGLALVAEAARVRVLAAMATLAIPRQRIVQTAASMTIRTVDVSVRALQGESGFLGVIELRGFPARRRVTVGAFLTTLAAMHVVRRMTGDALLRSALVAVTEMAREARDILVLVA